MTGNFERRLDRAEKKLAKELAKAEELAVSDTVALPHYDRAIESLQECDKWAKAGFPGASLADVVRIATNHEPETLLNKIRLRAERNANKMLGIRQRRSPPSLLTKTGQKRMLEKMSRKQALATARSDRGTGKPLNTAGSEL